MTVYCLYAGLNLHKIPMAMAVPFDACEKPHNSNELASKIALVGRGYVKPFLSGLLRPLDRRWADAILYYCVPFVPSA
jgi:hypothetical protein